MLLVFTIMQLLDVIYIHIGGPAIIICCLLICSYMELGTFLGSYRTSIFCKAYFCNQCYRLKLNGQPGINPVKDMLSYKDKRNL